MIYTEGWAGRWADRGKGTLLCLWPHWAGLRALWGTGTPQHLPEVVWPPPPWCWGPVCPSMLELLPGLPGPLLDSLAPELQVPKHRTGLHCWGDRSPPFRCPPTPKEGGEGGEGGARWDVQDEGRGGGGGSANGEAEATLELVLAVIEEGAQGQGQRQRGQLLLQRGAHYPVAVHRAFEEEVGLGQV